MTAPAEPHEAPGTRDAVSSTTPTPQARRVALVPAPRPERLDLTDHERGIRRGDVDAWGRSEQHAGAGPTALRPDLQVLVPRRVGRARAHPRDGGALLVANHAGAIPADAPVIMHGIETGAAAGRSTGSPRTCSARSPSSARCGRVLGGVAAHPDNAYRLLHDDHQLVLVFPEGTKGTGKRYRDRYKLHRFGRGGFVEIAMRSGVPVIPIAVVGNEEAMPILFKSRRLAALLEHPVLPRSPRTCSRSVRSVLGIYFPAKFRIRVLPPVHFDVTPGPGALPAQPGDGRGRAHPRHASRTRSTTCCARRRSVWFG